MSNWKDLVNCKLEHIIDEIKTNRGDMSILKRDILDLQTKLGAISCSADSPYDYAPNFEKHVCGNCANFKLGNTIPNYHKVTDYCQYDQNDVWFTTCACGTNWRPATVAQMKERELEWIRRIQSTMEYSKQ